MQGAAVPSAALTVPPLAPFLTLRRRPPWAPTLRAAAAPELVRLGAVLVPAPAGRDTADLLLASRACLFADHHRSSDAAAADATTAGGVPSAAQRGGQQPGAGGEGPAAAGARPVVVLASNDRRFAATLRYLSSRPGVLAVAVTAPLANRYNPGLPPDWRRHPLGREAGAVAAWRGCGGKGAVLADAVWVRSGLRGGGACG
jgi:hypothetical protein